VKRLCVLVLVAYALAAPVGAQEPLRVVARVFEPFSYLVDGKPAGLEYEILRYFAKAKGRELEVTWVDTFAELLPRFEQGDLDIATGTVTITAARAERFGFSESYFPVRVIVVEPRTHRTRDLADLAGETLVTNADTTYEELLRAGVPNARFVYAPDEEAALGVLDRGEARAAAVDTVLGLVYLPDFPDLHMTLPISDEQHYGFVVGHGSPLASELSEHINQLKAAGIYFRLLEEYLGQEAVEMVRAAKE